MKLREISVTTSAEQAKTLLNHMASSPSSSSSSSFFPEVNIGSHRSLGPLKPLPSVYLTAKPVSHSHVAQGRERERGGGDDGGGYSALDW